MTGLTSVTTLDELSSYLSDNTDPDDTYKYPIVQSVQVKPKINPKHRVQLGYLTRNNIGTLKKLNSVIFPVRYSEKWYKDVLRDDFEDFCRLVYFNDVPVGGITGRLEAYTTPTPTDFTDSVQPSNPLPPPQPINTSTSSSSKNKKGQKKEEPKEIIEDVKLYIMTLGVLAPYRRRGLGNMMVDHIVQEAKKTWQSSPAVTTTDKSKAAPKPKPPRRRVKLLYVHVQISNTESKEFWEKCGFVVKGEVQDYYKMVEPRGAWILEKDIEESSETSETA